MGRGIGGVVFVRHGVESLFIDPTKWVRRPTRLL